MESKVPGAIWIILIVVVIGAVGTAVIDKSIEESDQARLTYEKCCGGNVCTDTLYNNATGKCEPTNTAAIDPINEYWIHPPIFFIGPVIIIVMIMIAIGVLIKAGVIK